jgi:hypothetical protein
MGEPLFSTAGSFSEELTLVVPNVENFDRYKVYCIQQHVISAGILSIHSQYIFGRIYFLEF